MLGCVPKILGSSFGTWRLFRPEPGDKAAQYGTARRVGSARGNNKKGVQYRSHSMPTDRTRASKVLEYRAFVLFLLRSKTLLPFALSAWRRRLLRPFQIASRASRDVQIDRSVWKAHESMPLKNVYLLFANLRCIRLFVIAGDRLTGIISRSILYQVSSYNGEQQDRKCSFLRACCNLSPWI